MIAFERGWERREEEGGPFLFPFLLFFFLLRLAKKGERRRKFSCDVSLSLSPLLSFPLPPSFLTHNKRIGGGGGRGRPKTFLRSIPSLPPPSIGSSLHLLLLPSPFPSPHGQRESFAQFPDFPPNCFLLVPFDSNWRNSTGAESLKGTPSLSWHTFHRRRFSKFRLCGDHGISGKPRTSKYAERERERETGKAFPHSPLSLHLSLSSPNSLNASEGKSGGWGRSGLEREEREEARRKGFVYLKNEKVFPTFLPSPLFFSLEIATFGGFFLFLLHLPRSGV